MKVSASRSHSSSKVDSKSGPDKSEGARRADSQSKEPELKGKAGAKRKEWGDGWDDKPPKPQQGTAGGCHAGAGTGGGVQSTPIINRREGGNGSTNVSYVPGQEGGSGSCQAPNQLPVPWRPEHQIA